MTVSDNPQGNADSASLTQDMSIEKLAILLDTEPAKPTIQEDEAQDKPEAEAEGDVETPDEDADETEESEETETEEEAAAIELADDAEIDLGDGTRTTLADLKQAKTQVKEFQRDYTRKMEAVKADRDVVEQKAQKILETAQQLQQERETFLALAQEFLPAPPQRPAVSPSEDPIAWVEYQSAKEEYEGKIGKLQQLNQQRLAAQQQAEMAKQAELPQIVAQEREKLLSLRPALKDPKVAAKTKAEMASIISEKYGFSPDEIANVADSRAVVMMLDLLDYQRIKAAQPAAKAKVEAKPPLVKSAKRASPDAQKAKRFADLRDAHNKSKSVNSAVAILKALDL